MVALAVPPRAAAMSLVFGIVQIVQVLPKVPVAVFFRLGGDAIPHDFATLCPAAVLLPPLVGERLDRLMLASTVILHVVNALGRVLVATVVPGHVLCLVLVLVLVWYGMLLLPYLFAQKIKER